MAQVKTRGPPICNHSRSVLLEVFPYQASPVYHDAGQAGRLVICMIAMMENETKTYSPVDSTGMQTAKGGSLNLSNSKCFIDLHHDSIIPPHACYTPALSTWEPYAAKG